MIPSISVSYSSVLNYEIVQVPVSPFDVLWCDFMILKCSTQLLREGCIPCSLNNSSFIRQLFSSKYLTSLLNFCNLILPSLQTYTVTLNTGEAALAVAVGEGWSAVATSLGLLRLFSSTGIPIALVSLKGAIVTMVGYVHQLAGTRCMYVHTRILVLVCYISALL